MSGLAAGIRLAHFGQRVCILERHYAVGGLNSYYRLNDRNYDVGLHAVTNFTPRGARRGPLARILRQLRFAWEDFELAPQLGSRIAFPGATLDFTNDPALLESEVARAFPRAIDGFRRLQSELLDYDAIESPEGRVSAREIVSRAIDDSLLVEMLFCPLMYYGCAAEHDMDFGQFSIMFRSIFLEGFARPLKGVRVLIKKLVRRFKQLGGELRMRSGVSRIEKVGEETPGVVLDDGEHLAARRVLSSIGWPETLRLCGPALAPPPNDSGRLSFVESISTLDVRSRDIGHPHTIVFFNDHDRFDWRRPEELTDFRSGVICSPDNYDYAAADAPIEGAVRLTALANFDRWNSLDEAQYKVEKENAHRRMVESALRFVPDFREHVKDLDIFTPKTIRRFTGHDNGAVYGAPHKHYDGATPLKNLFICGTDQGFVGIIGALTSGIGMANRHFLAGANQIQPHTKEAKEELRDTPASMEPRTQ